MTRIHLSSDGMGRSFGLFRAVRFAVVSVTGRFGRPGQVRDEQVERIPRPGPRRREGWKGIREIFTVRAVHRCRQYPLFLSLRRGLLMVMSGSATVSCRMSAAFDCRRLRSALARQAPRIPLLLHLSSFVVATERGPAHAMSDPVPGRSLRK